MANSIPSLAAEASDADIVAALDEFGAVILEDFIGADIIEQFNRELDAIQAAEADREQGYANPLIADFFGDKVIHVSGLAGKSPTFVEHLLCHPRYMQLCDQVLKPVCSDYQLNIAHLLQRNPGGEAQLLHRDAWVWKRLPAMEGEVQLASMVALSDFTAENGATLVVPGSHRWGEERYPEPDEAQPAVMRAGSAVIYLGNTFHAGGANVTKSEKRRGLHVSYCAGWLRTEENQCLATPLALVRQMPVRAQQLLGFGSHDDIEIGGGYLGTVELVPPYKLIADDSM